MICPKCNNGELQEHEFDGQIGVCDNLDCGALFDESGKELEQPKESKKFIIYQKGDTRVYIDEKGIKIKGHKLKIYPIWRDEGSCSSELGIIAFNGRWRQYTSRFASNTEWSSGCKRRICEFEDMLNVRWQASIRRRK